MAPVFHGVMAGDIPLMGLGAEPKNMPVATEKNRSLKKVKRFSQ